MLLIKIVGWFLMVGFLCLCISGIAMTALNFIFNNPLLLLALIVWLGYQYIQSV
jgi:hypothetical protein